MNTARKRKLMFRWSIFTAGIITLFWFTWYLIEGSVPVITKIELTSKSTYSLPLGISRLWDILILPTMTCILIHLFTSLKTKGKDLLFIGGFFGLSLCFIVTFLALSESTSISHLISSALTFSIAFGLLAGLSSTQENQQSLVLGIGLGSSLAPGLLASLYLNLTFTLIISLFLIAITFLGFGLGTSLKMLRIRLRNQEKFLQNKFKTLTSFFQSIVSNLGNWLLARPTTENNNHAK